MHNKKFNTLVAAMALVISNTAYSQFVPAEIQVGSFNLIPTLNAQLRQNDNIFATETDAKSSMISILSPMLLLGTDNKVNRYQISYKADLGTYHDSADDNYFDQAAGVDIHQEFSRYFLLHASGSFNTGHEERGTGYSRGAAGLLSEPDRFQSANAEALLSYGNTRSSGQLEFAADVDAQTYTTRRSVTRYRDRLSSHGRGTFYYNLSAKTSFLLEANLLDVNYNTDLADSLDSMEQRYYTGASWDVGSLTEGVVKLGWQIKDFSDSDREDFSGFGWEAGVNWTPVANTKINLSTSSRTVETTSFGNYIDNKAVAGSLSYDINTLTTLGISGNAMINDYKPSPAKDAEGDVTIQVDYSIRRWLTAGVGYTYAERRSNQAGYDFKRNIMLLNLEASL